ncbi:MAG: Eco57I restriction-modification methylase domain-containing protein [Microgenomates group bacterium]|jgi:hypothetical protein
MKKNTTLLKKGWDDKVGYFPTPANIVAQFTCLTTDFIKPYLPSQIDVLDLFAGDGRLGIELSKSLYNNNYKPHTTFVEIQQEEIEKIKANTKNTKVFKRNIFKWSTKKRFDLVISNPPYLILNSPDAGKLGFNWEYAKKHGRNLYTLGIIKALALCREGGIVAVISPFSWLRGEYSKEFREIINQNCSRVLIKANDHRTVFKGVNQDIGFQFFIKRYRHETSLTKWQFGYNGNNPEEILFENLERKNSYYQLSSRVMVGTIVWNRNKEYLTSQKHNSTLVVYGGNIGHDGKLNCNISKYKDKQYIQNKVLSKTDVFESPLILIRRIMRGIPGNWMIDSCLIEKPFKCVVENHVIVIEIPKGKVASYRRFYENIMDRIKEYYYFSGSPSISGRVVKQIIMDLELSLIKEKDASNYLPTSQENIHLLFD